MREHGVPTRIVTCAGIGASGLLLNQQPALGTGAGGQPHRHLADHSRRGAGHDRRRVSGSIVAVSSISGTLADRDMGAYCVSKAGVDMLVKIAAVEWGATGSGDAVGPSVTRTPMLAKPEQLPGWVEVWPSGRRRPLG